MPVDDENTETVEVEEESTEEATEEPTEGAEEESAEENTEDADKESKLSPEDAAKALTKVRSEAANWRTKFRDLEKKLEAAKSPDQVEEIVTSMKAEREAAEHALIVENVGLKFNLPEELSSVLQGTTREELEAHAKTLAKFVAKKAPANDPKGGLNPTDEDESFDPVKVSRAARSRRY